jgi:hypothetical protein
MDWEAFLALLKRHPKKTIAAVVAVFIAGTSAGSWMLYAEQCHAQAKANEQVIKELLKYQEREIQREEAAAEQERRVRQEVARLCLAGKLKDKDECAKVGVEVDAD